MYNSKALLFVSSVLLFSVSLNGQQLGPNLVINPDFLPSGNNCGTNIISSCYLGWSVASGTPNTGLSGDVLFIWGRQCDIASEAIIGTLNTPLIPNKEYKLQITYRAYKLLPTYPGVVFNSFFQFTRRSEYIKADGSESVPNITQLVNFARTSDYGSDSTSLGQLNNVSLAAIQTESSTSCVTPTAKFPDLVTINGISAERIWHVENYSDFTIWKTEEISFVATEESTNFIISIISGSAGMPNGIHIKDIYVGEIICETPVPVVDISEQHYLCATRFISNEVYSLLSCDTKSYLWDFGDGVTSGDKGPIHVYTNSGTYNVSLSIQYLCGDCSSEVTVTKQITFNPTSATIETRLIEVETEVKNQVISASAVTFSDVWSLAHDNAALGNRSSYLNGTQGVWRNNASYAYDVPRQFSTPTNIATDGTFTLNQFDWNTANFNVVPDWIQANTMTQYSPYSFELENQDVLGIYSATLYDYGGQLPTANGVNMRHAEMGFTSFEFNDINGKPSGNWMLSSAAQPATITYQVPNAIGYSVVVNARLEDLDLAQKVNVSANAGFSGPAFISFNRLFNYLQDVDILCKQAHPLDPKKSIVVLGRAPFEGLWSGRLSIKLTAPPGGIATLDTHAHSGKSSLKVNVDQTFRQEMFQLEAGKTYWVNAWVSEGNSNLLEPKLANNLGIQLTFKDKIGQSQGAVSFQPAGTIIEGWQQVKGTFICPIDKPVIELTFRPGDTGTAWYDDLRLQPEKGNMKAYVYDRNDYRLNSILDEENYASFFYYDKEGNLYLTKKETERGIKTITENVSYQIENNR